MAKESNFENLIPISESEIKREETGPDQMPSFEMDSAYVEDRIKQEIRIEIPKTDSEPLAKIKIEIPESDSEPLAKRRHVEVESCSFITSEETKSKSVKKKNEKINDLKKQLAVMKEQKEKDNETIALLKDQLIPNKRLSYEETNFENYVSQAKKFKREADKLNNPITKSTRYIESVLYFILYADSVEQLGDHASAYTIYKDTISLMKYVLNYRPRLTNSQDPSAAAIDSKLAFLSYQCQSLLYLKLYKLRKNELKEISQELEELLKNGPSIPVPHTLIQKQYNYSSYLTQCHDLWDNAKIFVVQANCSEFSVYLEQTHGILNLDSSLKDLVKYTKAGLDYLTRVQDRLLIAKAKKRPLK